MVTGFFLFPMSNPPRRISTYSVPVEKDEEGFPLCRWCKASIRTGKRPKQRTFCDDKKCLHEWKIRSDPGYAAEHVLKRDHGVCATCGLDCVALLKKMERLSRFSDEFKSVCVELDIPKHLQRLHRRLWEMDHILPVVEGGGSCGLENLQSLCFSCHRKVTAELATRRKRRDA